MTKCDLLPGVLRKLNGISSSFKRKSSDISVAIFKWLADGSNLGYAVRHFYTSVGRL